MVIYRGIATSNFILFIVTKCFLRKIILCDLKKNLFLFLREQSCQLIDKHRNLSTSKKYRYSSVNQYIAPLLLYRKNLVIKYMRYVGFEIPRLYTREVKVYEMGGWRTIFAGQGSEPLKKRLGFGGSVLRQIKNGAKLKNNEKRM